MQAAAFVAVHLHIVIIIIAIGLHIDGDGDRIGRPRDQLGDNLIRHDGIAVQDDEIAVHLFPHDPAGAEVIGDLEERIEHRANPRARLAIQLQRMILDPLGAKARHHHDVRHAIGDQRCNLPAYEGAPVKFDHAFGHVAGQRQQA